MSAEQWFWGVVSVVVLAAIGWVAIEAVNAPTLEEPTPLDELLDGPEQVAEGQSATEMWDSFEEADVHGIEVDDTATEADMVPAIEAWLAHLDVEAWLGERGWL
jgi:hypothetical protein